MLAINPADPALTGKLEELDRRPQPKKKCFNRKYSLEEGFLNYALKETIRIALPENDPYRSWLELDKIVSFLKYDPSGLLYSGEKINPIEALKKFVAAHPDDAPGAFARYMLLIDTMDSIAPEERIKACRATVEALSKANVQGAFEESQRLLDCARHLETLSRIAAGETGVFPDCLGLRFLQLYGPKLILKMEILGCNGAWKAGVAMSGKNLPFLGSNGNRKPSQPFTFWEGAAITLAFRLLGLMNRLSPLFF